MEHPPPENFPMSMQISHDPVGAWRHEDPLAVRGLAALELRSAGVATPRSWTNPVF